MYKFYCKPDTLMGFFEIDITEKQIHSYLDGAYTLWDDPIIIITSANIDIDIAKGENIKITEV